MGGQPRNRIAALDLSTGSATGWNPDADKPVYAIAPSGSTIYAGGDFQIIGGQARSYIAALSATDGTATSWNPNANSFIRALAAVGSTVYAGGQFGTIGGGAQPGIAALDALTGSVGLWDAGTDDNVGAIAATEAVVCVGGSFVHIGDTSQRYFAIVRGATVGVDRSVPRAALTLSIPALVRGPTSIEFSLPSDQPATLEVFDVTGRRVTVPMRDARWPAGINRLILDPRGWPKGCYYGRLTCGGSVAVRKMIVLN
jgi:hypothetical protein